MGMDDLLGLRKMGSFFLLNLDLEPCALTIGQYARFDLTMQEGYSAAPGKFVKFCK
jgi:hypothetical protein